MTIIDIHSHILPGIDDGARDIEESLEILTALVEQGVREIIATPHVISGVYNNTREIIDQKITKLNAALRESALPIIVYPGAEVYCEPNALEKVHKEKLSLAGSRYVLVESDMQRFPVNIEELLYEFQVEGYFPILAHAERYNEFRGNFNLLIDLANKGIYVQMNAGSLLGDYGSEIEKLAHKILNMGCVHAIASDVHGLRKRPILLKEVYNFLSENYTEELAKLLLEKNPTNIIKNKELESMVEGYFEPEMPKKSLGDKIRNLWRK